jgi:hypothetical protein
MRDETTAFPDALDWTSLIALADQVSAVLHQAEAALALEQAVHGLDTMSEVALQTVLQKGLAHSYAVTREVHYPSSSGAKRSSRQRCDLVLSPRGTQLLPESNEQLSLHLLDSASAPRMYAPEESFWLEVKVAYQLRAGGLQHKGYSGQFRQAVVADLRKLAYPGSHRPPLVYHHLVADWQGPALGWRATQRSASADSAVLMFIKERRRCRDSARSAAPIAGTPRAGTRNRISA